MKTIAIVLTALPGLFLSQAPGAEPAVRLRAGDLELALHSEGNGVRLDSLRDLKWNQELLASNGLPLFRLTIRPGGEAKDQQLSADTGWRQVEVRGAGERVELRWSKPVDAALSNLAVTASATAVAGSQAFYWDLRVENENPRCSLGRVLFPQIALRELATNAAVLFPRGPGEVQKGIWRRSFNYHGHYPDGWCAMQFMAAYRETDEPTGLYVAVHDAWGGTKDLAVESDPDTRTVRLRFDVPAANLGVAGNDFELPGQGVWQLLRGDWFEAARMYKRWASREAKWWPQLSPEGRADTPLWMRELNAWAMTGGRFEEIVPAVRSFREFLGMPVGFHWYNWHQIPFDNDYPHYFPAKTNFDRCVRELEQAQVHVMPYINGRLWDHLDRGAEDYQFSSLALPAATKKEDGRPYLESYGSKETNHQPVQLAVMCPTTPLWQQKVRAIVTRLLTQEGTGAVYIDQIAAAPPTLCMDQAHGHPLGGGHWWNEGYWQMLEAIRQAMPRDRMLTTECNGEPFLRWFDGYLTWHWQHDGQVPAFPAVYGGAVQMFGRAYRGGATKDLALRMKAAQQLVYGEQLGWLEPSLVKAAANADFFRTLAKLRSRLNRYFYAGEMARPPKLLGTIPTVKADWQWSGEWWVTTDAVLTGAWLLPRERKAILIFVNVSEEAIAGTLRFEPAQFGIDARTVHAQVLRGETKASAQDWSANTETQVPLGPREALAYELGW